MKRRRRRLGRMLPNLVAMKSMSRGTIKLRELVQMKRRVNLLRRRLIFIQHFSKRMVKKRQRRSKKLSLMLQLRLKMKKKARQRSLCLLRKWTLGFLKRSIAVFWSRSLIRTCLLSLQTIWRIILRSTHATSLDLTCVFRHSRKLENCLNRQPVKAPLIMKFHWEKITKWWPKSTEITQSKLYSNMIFIDKISHLLVFYRLTEFQP